MVVAAHRLDDEMERLHEYSPFFGRGSATDATAGGDELVLVESDVGVGRRGPGQVEHLAGRR